MMLKLKLQYFGHLMRTTDSLERSLMLGEIEGGRRRGRQRMRWLDGITEAVDVGFGRWWGSERLGVLQSVGPQSRTRLGSWAAAAVAAFQCVLVSAVEHGGSAVCTCAPPPGPPPGLPHPGCLERSAELPARSLFSRGHAFVSNLTPQCIPHFLPHWVHTSFTSSSLFLPRS